jgi:glutamate-1-semialdehyde 2,1-aminomutase
VRVPCARGRARSEEWFNRSRRVIPGGVVSLNRLVEPEIAFCRAQGCRIWDVDGNEYIDYHGAFAPYLLGYGDPDVEGAVRRALDDGWALVGSGTTPWEVRVAELLVELVPGVEQVQLTTSGSEATFHALRLARAYTGADGVLLIQGGYNGWHNDVACNVMTPLEELGPRVSPGEYPVRPITAGIPAHVFQDVHVVNFNDLSSVEYVLSRNRIAAVMLEPVLHNVGVIKPDPTYLTGLRSLCDRYGSLLIFDEIKTGFRHGVGGYQAVCGVRPDLTTLGKAIANGYPLAAVGGRADVMALFATSDPARRVMIAGTYNGHPVPCAAAVATLEKLRDRADEIYGWLDERGREMEVGLCQVLSAHGLRASVARLGSAFCVYFMDHEPRDWHDLAEHHDFEMDLAYRRALIDQGVYHFPQACKQGSISFAHTREDVEITLERTDRVLATLV